MVDVFNFFYRSREARQKLEQHRARLYRIAYAWTHSAALADDLVQETLTKALTKFSQLRDPKASEAWLYSILTNCYRDHFRRSRETEDIDDVELVHENTPESESSQQQVVRQVRRAMARLPEGQRQVVSLVDLEGFSYIEVAEILSVPIGTVMSRLCRARAALKEQLLSEMQKQAVAMESKIRRIK
jgi:RNA polymerase sigma-70 factor (ECF subfamily)